MQLGVSRTPVREALARLESEGLIAAEGRSFVVPVLSDADVDEIYELRGMLEPAALAQVAKSVADPKALARIADALRAKPKRPTATDDADASSRPMRASISPGTISSPTAGCCARSRCHAGHVRYLRVLTLNNAAARKAALAGMKNILAALRKRDAGARRRASCASI